MSILQVIILSLVEGVSEFLPISSTGHLILVSNLLKIPQTEFVKSFEIIIQLGAVLSVLTLFAGKLVRERRYWRIITFAFIPTAVVGLLLYKLIKHFLLGNSFITVLSLFIGGIIIILFERSRRSVREVKEIKDLGYLDSVIIGLVQSLSVIPGISRAAAAIIGGMGVGLSRKDAVEFSFMLALPTIFAASALDLFKSGLSFSANEYQLMLVGFIFSFVTAFIVVKYFINYIKTRDLVMFGYYRIIVAVLFFLLVVVKW